MKSYILFLAIITSFLFSTSLYSQNKIDSLEKVLPTLTGENKIKTLLALGYMYNKIDFKKAKEYELNAIKLSKEINYLQGLGSANQYLGDFHKTRGINKQAIDYYMKALEVANKLNNESYIYILNFSIGLCYGNKSDNLNAKIYYEKALTIVNKQILNEKNNNLLTKHYNNSALLYTLLAEILLNENLNNKAFEYLDHSLVLSKNTSNTYYIIKNYNLIAGALVKNNELLKAEVYLDSAFNNGYKSKDKSVLSEPYLTKAQLLLQKSDYSKALLYCDSANQINSEMKEPVLLAETKALMAEILYNSNQYLEAEKYFKESINELRVLNNELSLANSYYRYGEYFNKVGDYTKSNQILQKSLVIFKRNKSKSVTLDIYKLLEDNAKRLKDTTAYNEFNFQKNKILDSANIQNISTLVKNFELKAENERNSKEALLTKKEAEIQKIQKSNVILISSILIIALLVILILVYYQYRLKTQTSKKLAELNATKDKFFTIISHDLKTPIASFHNRTEVFSEYFNEFDENEKLDHIKSLKIASENVLNLLDNLLTWSRIQTEKLKANFEIVNLSELVENDIKNEIENASKKNISFKISKQDELLIYTDLEMIKAIIRNLTSNAIKYSIENGIIEIKAYSVENQAIFEIVDYGIGIKNEDKNKLFKIDVKHSTLGTSNEKGTGLGLNLCKEFIELNNGKIWFESEYGKGSKFYISFNQLIEEE